MLDWSYANVGELVSRYISEETILWLRIAFLYLSCFAVITSIVVGYKLLTYLKHAHPQVFRGLFPEDSIKTFQLLQPYFLPFSHELSFIRFVISKDDLGDKIIKSYKVKIRGAILVAFICIIPALPLLSHI